MFKLYSDDEALEYITFSREPYGIIHPDLKLADWYLSGGTRDIESSSVARAVKIRANISSPMN